MNCNEVRPLLDANADRELPAPDARRVQQHIESCEACRRESEYLRAMSVALRAAPYHRAPESLRSRILAGLPEVESVAREFEGRGAGAGAGATAVGPGHGQSQGQSQGQGQGQGQGQSQGQGHVGDGQGPRAAQRPSAGGRPRGLHGWLDRWFGGRPTRGPQTWGGESRPAAPGGAAAPLASGWLLPVAFALGAVAVAVTLNLRRPAEFPPFADELIASHVRAQVSGRDIDVISTDRHTVKPWFNGRLDYSPPVEDLAANGFSLEGGRLDYLAHRRVAVLVYRYRKHVIDVYVFPQTASAGSAAPAALAREGYSLAHWDAEGMTWWAITDAAPDTLSGLEAALKARFAGGSGRTENG
ncbi:anti-sigma factor family protein [Burkholderia sp. WSM2230]|uniref:anti-sigma factor family protein n=1 Tax=Burkholderia sp. WSM2230 TaxID=944435 RepID=UPI0004718E02|nr:zf-HC2 domain-containing protein [Burkholderia sp. WSM2230]